MEYNSGTIKTNCNHKFCSKCWDKLPLDNWQRIKCPLCRFNVHPYDDVQIKYACIMYITVKNKRKELSYFIFL